MNPLSTDPREAEAKRYQDERLAFVKGVGPRPIPPKWHPDFRTVLPELMALGLCDEHGNRLAPGSAPVQPPPQAASPMPPQQPVAVGQPAPAQAPPGYAAPGARPGVSPGAHAGQPPHPGASGQAGFGGQRVVSNLPQRSPGVGRFQQPVQSAPMAPPSHGAHQGRYISNHQPGVAAPQRGPASSHHGFHSPQQVPPAMAPQPTPQVRPAPMPPSQAPRPQMAPPEQIFSGTQASPMPQQQPVAVGQPVQPQPQAQPQPGPRLDDGRIKAAVVGPRMLMTGAERFVMDLLKHVDGTKIRWDAVAVMQPEFFIPQIELQDSGAQPMGAAPGIQMAGQMSDVAIVWGMPVPPELGDTKVIHLPDAASFGDPAIDPERIKPTRSREEVRSELRLGDRKAIAFIGRLHNLRNPYALVQAMMQLPKEEYVAVFVGEGDHAVELRMYCEARLGGPAEDRFRFLGSRPDIGDILAAVDAVVVPSLTPTHGYTILEAWAAGVPVLATPVGVAETRGGALLHLPRALNDVPQHLRHEQLQVPELAERVGKLYAEAIVDLFDSPDTQKRVARGLEVAAEYHPQAFGERWTKRIQEALG